MSTYNAGTFYNIGNPNITVSCWFKTDGAVSTSGYYAICGLTWASDDGFGFKLIPSSNLIALSRTTGTSAADQCSISYSPDSAWHYLVASLSAGQQLQSASIYLDGVQKTATCGSHITVNINATVDTGQWDADGYAFPNGNSFTDEFRWSNTVRSAGWIATEYNNQNSPSSFFSEGSQQTNGGSTVTITVTSAPSGLSLSVNGTGCTAPCSFQWTPGSNQTIAVSTSPQGGGTGTQYLYEN